MSEFAGNLVRLLINVFIFGQIATYIMSAILWFSTPYSNFWLGFKELIWAVVPVANFFYVWEWWVTAYMYLRTV